MNQKELILLQNLKEAIAANSPESAGLCQIELAIACEIDKKSRQVIWQHLTESERSHFLQLLKSPRSFQSGRRVMFTPFLARGDNLAKNAEQAIVLKRVFPSECRVRTEDGDWVVPDPDRQLIPC